MSGRMADIRTWHLHDCSSARNWGAKHIGSAAPVIFYRDPTSHIASYLSFSSDRSSSPAIVPRLTCFFFFFFLQQRVLSYWDDDSLLCEVSWSIQIDHLLGKISLLIQIDQNYIANTNRTASPTQQVIQIDPNCIANTKQTWLFLSASSGKSPVSLHTKYGRSKISNAGRDER